MQIRKNVMMLCFNQRSHKGSDSGPNPACLHTYKFQSTLPQRERLASTVPMAGVVLFQSTLPQRERPKRKQTMQLQICFNPRSHKGSDKLARNLCKEKNMFQSTLPQRERQQFRPKIHSNFQQKSTNYHFIYLIFPFFHPLFFLHSTSFVHILECESPGIFMCASYSHSYIITKYIICCNSTIGTFFCFIYKSAPFL